ncbi:hypothetical protein QR680_018509 [Steinernema hermaphroditum]|uniref:Uncharacterized protein n=1 Tax=Steinernema hermaphroditum TaxID=289476 RepID=A0AA39HI59_9BILA|nr:hypothetical protein QR680_018509 [Steinernema hermaphroditum]
MSASHRRRVFFSPNPYAESESEDSDDSVGAFMTETVRKHPNATKSLFPPLHLRFPSKKESRPMPPKVELQGQLHPPPAMSKIEPNDLEAILKCSEELAQQENVSITLQMECEELTRRIKIRLQKS